ncbi:MAG: hypothetical protein HY519_03905 [Candidatus Aenigmarchaeota archaeon]|nr:hypothetical protein [Candidatus Aenigmarchaeota archaeon]
MGWRTLIAVFMSFSLLMPISQALSYSAATDKSLYPINSTIAYTGVFDQAVTVNVTLALQRSGSVYNSMVVSVNNSINFTANITANVSASGDYLINATFTYNGTAFTANLLTKISRASTFVLNTDKAVYQPNEMMSITVKAVDSNGAGVTGENMTIKMHYQSNDTEITSASGLTDSGGAGELSVRMTAPAASGTYRLVANDWLATRIFDVAAFDMVTYTGDASGNIKTIYGVDDTAYIYVDLFGANKTRYTNSETVTITVTYPNGTASSASLTYSGAKINRSIALPLVGNHSVRVQPASITKSILLGFDVQPYELRTTLESAARGPESHYYPGEQMLLFVKVYNVTSGELITATNYTSGWSLRLLDSQSNIVGTLANESVRTDASAYRFNFTAPNITGLYYLRIDLNGTDRIIDFAVKSSIADSMPVSAEYAFKNVFVGNKQTVRILTTLANASGAVNVTNVTVLEIKNMLGGNVKANLTINTSLVTYKGSVAGLAEFAAPQDAGWYFIKTIVNDGIASDTWFHIKLYSICSQLSGYRWFISSNDTATLTVKVTAAKDIGFMDSIAGNLTSSGSSSFNNMYGMYDCYGGGYTTVSGSSSQGNATANIRVSVTKVTNTVTLEDMTTQIASLPSNNTDSSGQAALSIASPSNGWTVGSYLVEFTMRDQANSTEKGWGWFTVKNLWINVWPKQSAGYWKWYFAPSENFTFEVYSYNSTSTWYYYGQGQGTGDSCGLLDLYYTGDGSEWFWPPRPVPRSKYTWSCTNITNSTGGRFNLNVTPTTAFATGNYMAKVRVNASSLFDIGEGWFSVKAYNVYMRSASNNYYDSWYKGATENVSFTVDIANANSTYYSCYWSACPASERAAGAINVTLKKVTRYNQWQPGDYAPTKYLGSLSNGSAAATGSIITNNGTATLTIAPKAGAANDSWESGYYSAVLQVSGSAGTETASGWFEIRSFFADLTPVNANGTQKYAYRSDENITVNVSAASKPKWMSSYNVNLTYYNVTIISGKLSYWSSDGYRMVTVPANFTPTAVNGTGIVTVIPGQTLAGGNWYNLELTLRDANGNEQTGYTSFEVKDFSFATQTLNWRWEFNTTDTIQVQALVCDPNSYWCNSPNSYTGSPVNISVLNVYRSDSWPYTAASGWSADAGQATSGNNGTVVLNISQGSSLPSGSYNAELSARYADGSGAIQKRSVWFSIKAYTLNIVPTKWEFNMRENITLSVTAGTALTLSSVSLSCGYWPDQKTFTLGSNLAANTTSIAAGTTHIKLSPSGTSWANGYCYGSVVVTDGSNSQSFYVNVNMKAFTFNTYLRKYQYAKTENVTVNITTDVGQQLNIVGINVSNYENWPNVTTLSLDGGSINVTATSITGNGLVNITPTSGQWPLYGYYSGQIEASDAADSGSRTRAWISFQVPAPLYAWGYAVDRNGNYMSLNTSSRNITMRVSTQKYNSTYGYYIAAPNVSVNLLRIEYESCSSYPCTYSTVTGYTVVNATSDSSGTAYLNLTRPDSWSYGGHRMIATLTDPSTSTTVDNQRFWFWVYQT